ncbi:phosphoribosylaminoimidazole synthetase [Streptococcus pneumoniae]|nr:phosphoribosylaminoimidazole synthetase [Streptococcus pneumoniae]
MTNKNAYAQSGVDVEAGYEVVERIKKHVARTERAGVMGALGGFGGMFDLSKTGVKEPVLISGTDGVGTKLMLAIKYDKHDTIGQDCVAMCVNDIIAAGAEPLYFLDYVATGKNEPAKLEQVVAGVAEGCVRLVLPSSVGKRLKCRACTAKTTMTWLVLRSVWLKNLKSLTVQRW